MGKPASQQTALWVLKTLREAGFQSFFAGGCVRDRLMGTVSADFDVATDATPDEVAALFDHVLLIGAQFGVAMVVHHARTVEVATFRSDGAYTDGRRPDNVTFSSAKEDALRRDFTINGMFYDPIADEVIDYVGGQADLEAGVIRTIGDPNERFGEDYLRLIRAVRFSARFEFTIDRATEAAIVANAEAIESVSGERVFDELRKMLGLPSAPTALEELHRLGLAQVVLPELVARDCWNNVLRRVKSVASCHDSDLTLEAALAVLDEADVRRLIRRWGAPNELRDAVLWTSKHLNDWHEAANWPLARFKRLVSHWQFNRLCLLWLGEEQAARDGAECHQRIRDRLNSLDPLQISPVPLVTGADLLELGLTESPRLGEVLNQLYDDQLNEYLTDREAALERARELIGQPA